MVKRCSAKNCYNSQLTHKIGYFGYPKNEVVARDWAKLAGRDDLAEKKLMNLTKYYLCSDHFTDDAFMNPDVEDKSLLRLNKTYSIPLPKIFEDNLLDNIKKVSAHPERFINYTKQAAADISSQNKHRREAPKKQSNEQKEEDECTEYLHEELEITRSASVDINAFCRLCAQNTDDLTAIFDENGYFFPETECIKVMPQTLIQMNDGLPQAACMECLEKLQSCAAIIEGFTLNQTLFVAE